MKATTSDKAARFAVRVPYLDRSDLRQADQDLLDHNINLNRALVHSPNAARSWASLGNFIRFESRLDPRLRELAILQVGYLMRSAYEYSHHIKIGRDFGVSDDDIRAIALETEGQQTNLDPLSRTVLRAAREMTLGVDLSDETYAALQTGLDSERIVDLTVTIAYYCGVVRLLAAIRIDVEDDYLIYLQQFPLPEGGPAQS